MDQNALKEQTGKESVKYIKSGMIVGLGTGSTVKYMVDELGKQVQEGKIKDIIGVTTSNRTAKQARDLGITIKDIDDVDHIDLTIDGADEISDDFQGIKGYKPTWRMDGDKKFRTDENNYIIDLHLGEIDDPKALANELIHMVGIVETGLFLNRVNDVIVGTPEGPKVLHAR